MGENLKNIIKDEDGKYYKVITVTEDKEIEMTDDEKIRAKDKFKLLTELREQKEEEFSKLEAELIDIDKSLEILSVFEVEEVEEVISETEHNDQE